MDICIKLIHRGPFLSALPSETANEVVAIGAVAVAVANAAAAASAAEA